MSEPAQKVRKIDNTDSNISISPVLPKNGNTTVGGLVAVPKNAGNTAPTISTVPAITGGAMSSSGKDTSTPSVATGTISQGAISTTQTLGGGNNGSNLNKAVNNTSKAVPINLEITKENEDRKLTLTQHWTNVGVFKHIVAVHGKKDVWSREETREVYRQAEGLIHSWLKEDAETTPCKPPNFVAPSAYMQWSDLIPIARRDYYLSFLYNEVTRLAESWIMGFHEVQNKKHDTTFYKLLQGNTNSRAYLVNLIESETNGVVDETTGEIKDQIKAVADDFKQQIKEVADDCCSNRDELKKQLDDMKKEMDGNTLTRIERSFTSSISI